MSADTHHMGAGSGKGAAAKKQEDGVVNGDRRPEECAPCNGQDRARLRRARRDGRLAGDDVSEAKHDVVPRPHDVVEATHDVVAASKHDVVAAKHDVVAAEHDVVAAA